MASIARIEPTMLHPEHVSEQKADDKPWLRQKNEPVLWYMRFRRYLDLGPKRSMRAALAAEPTPQKASKGPAQEKLSDVSVPGAWKRAAKVWHWRERTEAYDLAQMELQSVAIRNIASYAAYASKPYRILKLDYLARMLYEWLKTGTVIKVDEKKDFLAIIARYQSVLRDMSTEMQGFDGMENTACDAKALMALEEEAIDEEAQEKLKSAAMHEHNRIALERAAKLDALKKQ